MIHSIFIVLWLRVFPSLFLLLSASTYVIQSSYFCRHQQATVVYKSKGQSGPDMWIRVSLGSDRLLAKKYPGWILP